MAKDTEKLIRQLSLISFLMAQGRPVSALEIKREVEGYSDMNDDAFARRFYADRAELESLGILLGVEKPGEGFFEAELYSLPPENFYLDAIKFSDDELAALSTALLLLTDGGFAYAEPLRLALQQVAWGHPNPLTEAERGPGRDGDDRLRRRPRPLPAPLQDRDRDQPPQDDRVHLFTMERGETEKRKVDPYHLVFRGGQFYLIGYSHERDAVRVFRLSRIQGKVGYASKAEHDFSPPEDFDRRDYGSRADWQLGETKGTAKILIRERIAWLIERDFGSYGDDARRQEVRRGARQGQDLRNQLRLPPRADRLGAALAGERRRCWRPTTCARRPRRASDAAARPPRQRLRAGQDRRPAAARRAPPLALQRPRRGGDPARALRPPRHPRRDADRSGERRASACRSPTCASGSN